MLDTTFSAFMKGNVAEVEEETVQVSARFSEPFRIKAISAAKKDEIEEKCQKRSRDAKGRMRLDLDTTKFNRMLTAAGVSYPDLNNAALQDSYGVHTPEELLSAMLTAGEVAELQSAVLKLSGFDVSLADEMDEAKN